MPVHISSASSSIIEVQLRTSRAEPLVPTRHSTKPSDILAWTSIKADLETLLPVCFATWAETLFVLLSVNNTK